LVNALKIKTTDQCHYTLCSEKNTHSHFLSYLHELFVDLNKNCSEYAQGLIDSDNVKLDIHCDRWRNYDVKLVWLKLERVYNKPWSQWYHFFASTGYLDAVISCIMWWNLRQ